MIASTRPTSRPRKYAVSILVGLIAPITLAACGDDDGASAEYQAFCDAELEVEKATSGEDGGAIESSFAALVEASPDDVKPTVESVIAEAQKMMEAEGPPSDEFNAAYGEMMSVVKDECGYEDLEVAAKDYEFSGIDGDMAAGPTVVTFENQGTEYHEVLIMKRNEGDDTPVEELLMMDEEEANSMVSQVGAAFAAPGAISYGVVDLEPGNYIAVCFLPTGSTQDAFDAMMTGGPQVDGQPHAMNGMTAEFEVTS